MGVCGCVCVCVCVCGGGGVLFHKELTICLLYAFLFSADFCVKINFNFLKKSFTITILVSNSLDPTK